MEPTIDSVSKNNVCFANTKAGNASLRLSNTLFRRFIWSFDPSHRLGCFRNHALENWRAEHFVRVRDTDGSSDESQAHPFTLYGQHLGPNTCSSNAPFGRRLEHTVHAVIERETTLLRYHRLSLGPTLHTRSSTGLTPTQTENVRQHTTSRSLTTHRDTQAMRGVDPTQSAKKRDNQPLHSNWHFRIGTNRVQWRSGRFAITTPQPKVLP